MRAFSDIVNMYTKLLSLFLSFLFSLAGISQSVVGYTDGTPIIAQKQNYSFDNNRLLIGGYYGGKGLAKLAKDAGLDFIIETGLSQSLLDEYYEAGVGIIAGGYSLPRLYGDCTESDVISWINLDVSKYKNHPAIWGDDLIDEPTANCFATLQKANESYKKSFNDKICLINLFPIYADEDQLGRESSLNILQKALLLPTDYYTNSTQRYMKHVSDYVNTIDNDYICVDIYPYDSMLDKNGNEVKTTMEHWLRNLDILAQAARETNRDLWVITQAAGLTEKGTPEGDKRYCDDECDISQQAFASLAFGSKAVIHGLFSNKGWWDTDSHMIGSNGKPTETYYAVSKVDSYLHEFAEIYGDYKYTSTYLINSKKAAGYTKGGLATTVESEKINIKTKNGLLVGTFDGNDGSKAYVVTNMEELNNDVTAKATLIVPEGKTVNVYYKGIKTQYNSGESIELCLSAGAGAFITVK